MTLCISWVRQVGSVTEMIVASDSRLSGGQFWDANPKILMLPRSDAVLTFAGSTNDAYPLMLMADNSIRMHQPAYTRSMDLSDLKGHLVRVFNHSRKFITGLPANQLEPDMPNVEFQLCGYSWKYKNFITWKLHFDKNKGIFTFRRSRAWGGQDPNSFKYVTYAGDEDVVDEAKKRLVEKLRSTGKIRSGSLDMEPFEVLRDLLREEKFSSIGGPIQMVKIYEHANAVPMGVFWPNKEAGVVSILGRPLMDYEKIPWGVIDPDDPSRAYPMEIEPCKTEDDASIE
ncbi:hypothetical protein [Pararhizobium mangrovi]|uniref:Uncharacterized protein n=1 Tax=Pararhizobium mangrovi TaxID=2590452 RepID=A0A506TYN1_9HYPH|nr:hypothetical protein [Pararhizobium mangrovi]TPW25834.1 hypothetical protein FJU11_17550 [Pararhizobium mangrovi]